MRRQSNSALLCMYGGWKRHYREKVESCVQCVFKNVQERRRKKPHWSTAAYENARADERWRELVAGGMKGHCWLVSGTMWGVGAAVWRGGHWDGWGALPRPGRTASTCIRACHFHKSPFFSRLALHGTEHMGSFVYCEWPFQTSLAVHVGRESVVSRRSTSSFRVD